MKRYDPLIDEKIEHARQEIKAMTRYMNSLDNNAHAWLVQDYLPKRKHTLERNRSKTDPENVKQQMEFHFRIKEVDFLIDILGNIARELALREQALSALLKMKGKQK